MDHPRPPAVQVAALRAVTLAALVALVALGLGWETVLAPTGSGTLAIKVLPLLLCVPGVLRHRLYTYRWLSLLVWLYVIEGVVRASGDAGLSARLALAEIGLCAVLFSACCVYVRWRLRGGGSAA